MDLSQESSFLGLRMKAHQSLYNTSTKEDTSKKGLYSTFAQEIKQEDLSSINYLHFQQLPIIKQDVDILTNYFLEKIDPNSSTMIKHRNS